MISSNINEILLKTNLENQSSNQSTSSSFLNTLVDSKESITTTNNIELTYENITSMSLSQIEESFTDEEKKSLAKNLKTATMFSNDTNLSKALFNTVLGQPFELGYNYLFNMFEDKSSFLNFSKNDLSSILQKSVQNRYNNEDLKAGEKIPQARLDEILTSVNSFDFLSSLTNSYKDLEDRDKDNDYSFLYNDYYLQYQELKYKYQNIKDTNNILLNQFK